MFTSYDLVTWKRVSDALPVDSRPEGIYYRPKVVVHPVSGLYILWVNMVPRNFKPSFWNATYIVATSSTPEGPFEVKTWKVNTRFDSPGDFSLFVDDDGSGYVAYDAYFDGHTISVEKLTDDFLNSLGSEANSGFVPPHGCEAPALIKRNGWYFLTFGHVCCFCDTGSNAYVNVATSPLGPWEVSLRFSAVS